MLDTVEAKEACTKSKPLSSIDSIDGYDALFIPGGHGIVFDGPGNKEMAALIVKFWTAGKIVSAVCHGPIALCGVEVDGKPLVEGKKVHTTAVPITKIGFMMPDTVMSSIEPSSVSGADPK